MHFGDERETARNCPHCHAFSRMSPQALPTFDRMSKETQLRVEEDNVKISLHYAREKLNL